MPQLAVVQTSSGRTLRLGEQLGRGGEGIVFAVADKADWALKIYKPELARERFQKIKVMVDGRWGASLSIVAFPLDTLFDAQGRFVGFAMRRVGGYKPIHRLYGPTCRKTEFPTANFKFLTHVASNTSRAVAAVHETGCVIGDINHSGVLVSGNGTVTLIDSDSFQVASNGTLYPCKVGVPEFTPPELQGVNLGSVRRIKNHDGFGLAVLIFQLLFMGRHPFAGTPLSRGDAPLATGIKTFRFAYSPQQNLTLMKPPPGVPTLADLPPNLGLAFHRAFDQDGATKGRPSAASWLTLLKAARNELTTCRSNPAHQYFRQAADCPWCRMEAAFPGLLLFNTPITGVVLTSADISSLSAALNAIGDPGPAPDVSKVVVNLANLAASTAALQVHSQRLRRYLVLGGGIGAGLLLLMTSNSLLGLLAIGGAWYAFKQLPDATSKLEAAKNTAQVAWNTICQDWQTKTGNQPYLHTRLEALKAIKQLAELPNEEKRLLQELNQKRRDLQLIVFLEKYRLDRANITHIGPGRRLQLASYGIETAADVTKQRVLGIPGFGDAIANSLLAWRKSVEAKFVFNAAVPVDPKEIAKVKAQVAKQKAAKVSEARRLIHQLDSVAANAKARRRTMQPGLQASYRALKQAEYDSNAAKFIMRLPNRSFRPSAIIGVILGIALLGGLLKAVQDARGPARTTVDVSPPATLPRPQGQGEIAPKNNQKPNLPLPPKDPERLPNGSATGSIPLPEIPPRPVSTEPSPQPENPQDQTWALPPGVTIRTEPTDALPILEPENPTAAETPSDTANLTLESLTGAKAIQRRLVELGYLIGEPDGIWGPRSHAALKVFRSRAGLEDNANWDSATAERLFAPSAPKNRQRLIKKARPSELNPLERPGGMFGFD